MPFAMARLLREAGTVESLITAPSHPLCICINRKGDVVTSMRDFPVWDSKKMTQDAFIAKVISWAMSFEGELEENLGYINQHVSNPALQAFSPESAKGKLLGCKMTLEHILGNYVLDFQHLIGDQKKQ